MTPPWNTTFQLYVIDPRPIEESIPSLDEMFGGRFVQDLEDLANGRLRYANYVFGLRIRCLRTESWTEGQVYRLGGSNHVCCRFDTTDETDMAFHVRYLIRGLGFARIMSFDEYRDESIRRDQPRT